MAVADLSISFGASVVAQHAVPRVVRHVQLYFLILFVVGLAAFIFGVEGRFPAGLYLFPPAVGWLPPFSADAWQLAFAAHQQDPVYAACGGTVSLEEFRTLYWWEWLHRASTLAPAGTFLIGIAGTSLWPRYRFALPRVLAVFTLVTAAVPARPLIGFLVAHTDNLARFNVGQYRHAADVTFASLAVAAMLAAAMAPPRPSAASPRRRWSRASIAWLFVLLVDICLGALFLVRSGQIGGGTDLFGFPPLHVLHSFDPWWLNLVFNPYAIHAFHRALSIALWIAALVYFIWSWRWNRRGAGAAGVLFGLLTMQMALGLAALSLSAPPLLSTAHRVGAVLALAAAFLLPGRDARLRT
jgi:cytochrome c oxidase assembly protein subunit 15